MLWKTEEARLRMSLWTGNFFPSEERKITSVSGAPKSYGAMEEVREGGLWLCTRCGGEEGRVCGHISR